MIQGTAEWELARCGSIGASDAPRVVRKIKSGGYSADRASLMAEKIIERMTGKPFQKFKSWSMAQGSEREAEARMIYQLVVDAQVNEVAIVRHPRIAGTHASPDGLVGDRGLIEIKCPEAAAHLESLVNETISSDYGIQVAWELSCTGRDWCDYVSYNPDFPPAMQLWVKRFHRDEAVRIGLEREIAGFVRELDEKVQRLSLRYGRIAA